LRPPSKSPPKNDNQPEYQGEYHAQHNGSYDWKDKGKTGPLDDDIAWQKPSCAEGFPRTPEKAAGNNQKAAEEKQYLAECFQHVQSPAQWTIFRPTSLQPLAGFVQTIL
jgi:hypothetical protein